MSKYLDAVLSILLLLILVFSPTQYSFAFKGAHLSIADPLIWFAGLILVANAFLSQDSGDRGWIVGFLKKVLPLPENILFVALIALSIFKAQSKGESVKELIQAFEYVIVAFVLFSKFKYDDRLLKKIAVLFFFLISVVVLTALVQYFNKSTDIMGVKGTFGNRNIYGGFLAVVLPVVLSAVLLFKDWRIKIWGIAIFIIAGITLLSGGAALGIIAGCSLVCIFGSRKAFYIWLTIIVVAGAFILPRLPRDNVEVLIQSIRIYDEDGNVEPRYMEWQASLQMWQEDPLLGVGLGNYQSQIGTNYGFLQIKEGPKEHDHNNLFLVFGSSTGVLGLVGLLAMLLLWFQRTLSAYFSNSSPLSEEKRILYLGAAGTIAAFCITSIWTALLVRGVFLLIVVLVATAISCSSCRMENK